MTSGLRKVAAARRAVFVATCMGMVLGMHMGMACKRSAPASDQPPPSPKTPGSRELASPALPPAVTELQEVLAPIQAAGPGADRIQRACDAHRLLLARAFAVHGLAPPAGVDDQTPWRAAVDRLWTCTEELGAYCDEDHPDARFIAADSLACALDAFQDILELPRFSGQG